MHKLRLPVLLCLVLFWIAACTRQPEGTGRPVDWSRLPGWNDDHHAEAWPALLHSCTRIAARSEAWKRICEKAAQIPEPTDAQARAFFEAWFVPHQVINDRGGTDGLITGYFEPLLNGSPTRTEKYRYPLYKRPKELLVIELHSLYPQLQGMRLRGRLQGNKVVPFYSRREIESQRDLLRGNELFWVDDPVALFFLQIQGSGRIRLPDGRTVSVGYHDQNGHPYVPIGKTLVDLGELERSKVSLDTIRRWLSDNRQRQAQILNSNPSYVFFKISERGTVGSLNVPLTPQRSIAVHRKFIRLGLPVWLDTTLPSRDQDAPPKKYQRLMFAQDTGGAIRGAVRADVFWGAGPEARFFAGHMKQTGRLFVLLPKQQTTER